MRDRLDVLLTEYQVAQQNADAAGARLWQFTGILFVTVPGAVSVLVFADVSKVDPHWVIPMISVIAVALIWFWITAMMRESFYLRATFKRMREIEFLLDMDLHRRIHFWDEFNEANWWKCRLCLEKECKKQNTSVKCYEDVWPSRCTRLLGSIRTWKLALVIAFLGFVSVVVLAILRLLN